jgi:demethylmenaquinone methyltransferase/2-methoxy-6-polyprenyl-1,4-benzoquinol methylase
VSDQVQSMFAQIAPRYDTANDALSFGRHHAWRKKAVKLAGAKPGMSVLDCATGTGDLALAFKRAVGPAGEVVGTDFCEPMLRSAPAKAAKENLAVRFEVADAMKLPYASATFDLSSISFGIRNVDDPKVCLEELARVVKPGGRVMVLEFGQPEGLFGALFRLYARFLMPVIGRVVTGNRAAYEYLPRTAAAFPSGDQFVALMNKTGRFSDARATPLMFGTAWVYVGTVTR